MAPQPVSVVTGHAGAGDKPHTCESCYDFGWNAVRPGATTDDRTQQRGVAVAESDTGELRADLAAEKWVATGCLCEEKDHRHSAQ